MLALDSPGQRIYLLRLLGTDPKIDDFKLPRTELPCEFYDLFVKRFEPAPPYGHRAPPLLTRYDLQKIGMGARSKFEAGAVSTCEALQITTAFNQGVYDALLEDLPILDFAEEHWSEWYSDSYTFRHQGVKRRRPRGVDGGSP